MDRPNIGTNSALHQQRCSGVNTRCVGRRALSGHAHARKSVRQIVPWPDPCRRGGDDRTRQIDSPEPERCDSAAGVRCADHPHGRRGSGQLAGATGSTTQERPRGPESVRPSVATIRCEAWRPLKAAPIGNPLNSRQLRKNKAFDRHSSRRTRPLPID